MTIPLSLVDTLVEEFGLGENVRYPTEPIEPVYGINILEEPHLFCITCNRGYQNLNALRAHQSSDRCLRTSDEGEDPGYCQGYGQLIPGNRRRIIQVRLDNLVKKEAVNVDYVSLYHQTAPLPKDYAQIPLSLPEDDSNLTAFFRQDAWLSHIEGHSAQNLYEARRTHSVDEFPGPILRELAQRYLGQIQSKIQDNVHYGLLKNIGTTNV